MKLRINPTCYLFAFLLTNINAAILTWDTTIGDSAVVGGTGTWDTSSNTWTSDAGLTNINWPTVATLDDDAVFGGTAGTVTVDAGGVTANSIALNAAGYILQGGKITLNGTTPTISSAAAATINSELSGTGGLTKSGSATLTLTAANSYTGTTSLTSGTLLLSGGNNRLATAGTISFASDSTLDLGGNTQTLNNLTILTASASTKGTLTNGSLTLNGASALAITPSSTTGSRIAEIDATGLSNLTISKSGQAITVGGLAGATSPGNFGIFKLSATTNTITALSINIGTTSGANAANVLNKGELQLGAANTINTNTWVLGNTRDAGVVQFQSGLTNPSVTLRAQDGISRVTKITIGQNGAGSTGVGSSHLNLSAGSIDTLVNELVISRGFSGSTTPAVNGAFSMGGGTLDATKIWLSKNEGGGQNANTSSFTQGGGTVKVESLVFGETTATTSGPVFNAQYSLSAGELRAGEIKSGIGTFATTSIRRINFNGGTISHYDESTDLTINGVTGTGGSIGIVLGTSGSPTIHAGADRTVTLGGFATMSGAGSLTKSGGGLMVLTGSSTYTGSTSVNGGILRLNGADRLPVATALNLANVSGVAFELNNNNQAIGSLSGGGTLGGNVSLGTAILKIGDTTSTSYNGQITGTGSLQKVGTGTLSLNGNSTISLTGLNVSGGILELNAGTYTITGSAGTGTPDSTTGFIVSRGGTVRVNGASISATGGSYVFTAGNTGGNGSSFIMDSGSFDAGNKEVLNAYGSSGTFTINGGTFIGGDFRISQSATGTVNLNGGILRVNTLKHSNNTEIINFDGGTLQAKANTASLITADVDTVNIRAGGATIDSNGFSVTIPKNLSEDSNSTGGGLTKIGTGTLTLTASNTYSGGTTLSAGTLLANNTTGSATGSGDVVVNGGSLGGTGVISGNVTINVNGTLAPGASIESLSIGSLSLNNGSAFQFELNTDSSTADLLDVAGDLNLSGLVTLNLADLGNLTSLAQDTRFTLISYSGSWNGNAFDGFADDTIFSMFNNQWRIDYDDLSAGAVNGGAHTNAITLTVVPETSTSLLSLLGALAMLRRRR